MRTTVELKKGKIAECDRGGQASDPAPESGMAKSTVSTILNRKEAIGGAEVAKGVAVLLEH